MKSRAKNFPSLSCMILLVVLFLLFAPLPVGAANTDSIRVGYYKNGDSMYHSTQEEYEGYHLDLPNIREFVHQHTWLVLIVLLFNTLIFCIYLFCISRWKRRIQELLYLDGLTRLDNLDRFYIKAADLIQAAVAKPAPKVKSKQYALVYCDIDQFKLINDNFGFEEGDQVLRTYGQIIQKMIGKQECCARISADNFILLMEYQQWGALKDRLLQIKDELNAWRRNSKILPDEICLSFGVYLVMDAEQNNVHRMMDLANYARRSAKNNTENAIVLYDEQMRQKELLEQQLESQLVEALKQQEFEVYYQPKVDMTTGDLIGSEALVRWNHPKHGLLMPGAFIPFFEQKGLVVQVDLYLYDMVCHTIRHWLNQKLPILPVSCNFSRLHFGRAGFVEQVADIADQYDIPHSLLEIEITESTIASDADSVDPILTALKKLGFLIAIDDFGSGYSSLGQLQQLHADVLKLDRSFVSKGLLEKREQIVIQNLVNMSNELEMAVICEGVENKRQAETLQKLGCHFAQGYYYYRPMPVIAFETLLIRSQKHSNITKIPDPNIDLFPLTSAAPPANCRHSRYSTTRTQ